MRDFMARFRNLAPYQRNRLWIAGAVFVLILILILLNFIFTSDEKLISKQAKLVFWDVVDEDETYFELINKYRFENPDVTITVERKQNDSYYKDLTDALAKGEGPDIYVIHNTWLPFEQKRLISLNEALPGVNPDLIISEFPDVVRFDFTREDEKGVQKLYALPIAIDTLALYYNEDYFNSANLTVPPITWDDFVEYVKRLRVIEGGQVKLAGIAMGSGSNVNRAMDILSMLMIQAGVPMNEAVSNLVNLDYTTSKDGVNFFPGRDALRFYTSFSDPASNTYSWNPAGHYSIDAFSQSEATMMLNYSYHMATIRKKNPNLNFAIGYLPQPKDRLDKINYASYWGFAVSKASKSPDVAWDFINFITKEENAKMYLGKTNRPPALKSLIEEYENSDLAIFAKQILSARSWIQSDTFRVEKIFIDGIESAVSKKETLDSILSDMEHKINFLFNEL